jgi:hypothetical protein
MVSKFGDRPMVVIEQGGTAERTFNAANGTIDNITKTVVFSYCKLMLYREIAKEQEQTNYNFIYLCGGDLGPSNYEVIPARRVFRHAGMDVSKPRWFILGNSALLTILFSR